jgi:hypothetical protein
VGCLTVTNQNLINQLGNVGVVKTYLGEITDVTNQTKAFGYIGFMWGLGGITGSMAGGLLARPAGRSLTLFD